MGALAAGASANVSAAIGPRDAGSYELSAVADVADAVIEQNETNNTYTASAPLVVKPVASSDLVATLGTSPSAPAAGDTVNFSVSVKNQGTVASAGGSHGITLTVVNSEGATVQTLTGTHSGVIAAGATAPPVALGTWAAANGSYTVKVVIADDANEVPVKRENNTSSQSLFVGRGAACRSTCTRPRTAPPAAARRRSAPTGRSATSRVRRRAAGPSTSTRPASSSSSPPGPARTPW